MCFLKYIKLVKTKRDYFNTENNEYYILEGFGKCDCWAGEGDFD